MPIRSNKRVHEFEWEFARQTSDQEDAKYTILYHDSDEYGPTVSVVDESGDPILSVPRSFFEEVSQELDEEDDRRNPSRVIAPPRMPITSPGFPSPGQPRRPGIARPLSQVTSLPVPVIERSVEVDEEEPPAEETKADIRDPGLIDESQPPTVSFSKRPPRVDPEEQREIMEERGGTPEERAAMRAAKREAAGKGIKRLADEDGE